MDLLPYESEASPSPPRSQHRARVRPNDAWTVVAGATVAALSFALPELSPEWGGYVSLFALVVFGFVAPRWWLAALAVAAALTVGLSLEYLDGTICDREPDCQDVGFAQSLVLALLYGVGATLVGGAARRLVRRPAPA